MQEPDYAGVVARQRAYFHAGHTRSLDWRSGQLKALQKMFQENHDELCDALWKDLRRNVLDADLMDVNYIVREAEYALDHLKEWTTPQLVHTPLIMKPGHVQIRRDPYGVTLIIGAWNEPFMLLFGPLVPALAAGNTAVLKPSNLAPACSAVVARLVQKYLDPEAVAIFEGGRAVTNALLAQHWDFIFFTGSPAVGKVIHEAAAKHLTPCVLELGGKNPTIVHSSADIAVAARRIVYGRCLNSGQVCTGPDYVLVWPEVKDELVMAMKNAVQEFYGEDPQMSPDYGRIANRNKFDRLVAFLSGVNGKIAFGGRHDANDLYIEPTVLVDVPVDAPIMQEEVFGPILPVLEIDSVDAVIRWVNSRPSPLGLYVFTQEDEVAERILDATSSGDACVNECTIHPLIHELPFGGVGYSGMGNYHGRWGFEAFTNARGVLYHTTMLDPDLRYPPYGENKFTRKIAGQLLP
jgi:aldehyde dehydrogenase (NAD+)